jgi:hypothetical protein
MDTVDARKPSSGLTQLTIRYDLYDGVETTLAFHGVSVQDLVRRAFIEVANAANGFDVVRQSFEIKANGRSLWFNAAAYPRLDEGEICLCITPGENPLKYRMANELLSELLSEYEPEPTTKTRH